MVSFLNQTWYMDIEFQTIINFDIEIVNHLRGRDVNIIHFIFIIIIFLPNMKHIRFIYIYRQLPIIRPIIDQAINLSKALARGF